MVVSNSTPLIAFARIGELELLRRIVGHVVAPAAVWDEITGATNRAGADEVQRAAWIEVRRPTSVGGDFAALLDQGEAQTIALAEELGASEVLLDERAARALASARGLKLIGSAGLLVPGEGARPHRRGATVSPAHAGTRRPIRATASCERY